MATVKIDTREQKPLAFSDAFITASVVEKLNVGDYSLVGYEDILTVERKGSTAEFAQNVLEKRFDTELEKMQNYQHGFVVCEFSMTDLFNYPINSGIPTKLLYKIKVTGDFLLKRMLEYQLKYNTKIILCDSRYQAVKVITSLFKRIHDIHKRAV